MKPAYEALKKEVNRSGFGVGCHSGLDRLFSAAATVLAGCERVPLISKVEGKSYFALRGSKGMSRPVNTGLFEEDPVAAFDPLRALLNGRRNDLSAALITRSVYTVAITCCVAWDVTSESDRKTQGTIFEWLCAAIIQAAFGVVPEKSQKVLNLDLHGDLPTDFVFCLGAEKPRFHLPVKTSTRERIIQVWAHQRVLDGVYGVGRFLAMPIILTETKLNSKDREVVEICLPWQWRLYQMHIACLWNVFYLDAPAQYLELDKRFPRIGVTTLGEGLCAGGRLDDILATHGLARDHH